MTEKEKAQAGYLYNANYDEEILKDIPSGVIAVGVPCRVQRKITEEDKKRYPILDE